MKKQLLLLLTTALLLGACTKQLVRPEFETIALDTLLSRNGNSCQVEYRFASIRNAAKSPALETIEQANIGYFFQLETCSGTTGEAIQASLSDILDNYLPEGPAPTGGEYEISIEAEGSVVDSLLGYVITRAGYTGGVQGLYGTECHTYSLNDGFELSLADIFSETQLTLLNQLIREKIAARYNASTDEELIQAGFYPEYIAPTENFLLSPEGITFYYNPYEIGCYALGSVEIAFSLKELDPLRTKQ